MYVTVNKTNVLSELLKYNLFCLAFVLFSLVMKVQITQLIINRVTDVIYLNCVDNTTHLWTHIALYTVLYVEVLPNSTSSVL